LNFHTFAADLACVLEALHIEKAHIVGFSDGAIIALHAALSTPERVRSMVLLGANYHPKGLRLVPRFCILVAYIWLWAASLSSKKMRKRREVWGLMVWWPKLKLEYISRINIPTLVVTGEKDMVGQRHNDKIHNAIAGSRRLVVPKGDHFWMRKQPELFQQHVVEFLQKHSHH
jgi:pimeloyl-ACP methyl ester carboxylesterase